MIDQGLARRLAGLLAGEDPPHEAPADLVAGCADAQKRITAYTGLAPAETIPPAEAIGRRGWIDANLTSMAAMVDPVADKAQDDGLIGGLIRTAVGPLLSAEAGALAGYLSQRVLGQYEVALTDPRAPARLLFVTPNIGEAAGKLGADLDELWTWIAVHEVTHAVQFTSVPWLREHVAGLLDELLASLEIEIKPSALLRLPSLQDLRGLLDAVRAGGLVAAVAGPERREVLDRLQVTMAIIEGHAEHVMDVVGADLVPNLQELRGSLDQRRRRRPPALRLLEQLIGMEAKLRQYEDGKRFCDVIVAEAGAAALHDVFTAPAALPTADELADPLSWLLRRARDGSVTAV